MKDRPALRSLDGLEAMPWLNRLGIHQAPLEDTSALARTRSPMLAILDLPSCRRIDSLNDFSGLTALRELDVSDSGNIESLRPIAGLVELERLYLYGSTAITDGDMTPLTGLTRMDDLRIMNRGHYSPSIAEVKTRLGLAE